MKFGNTPVSCRFSFGMSGFGDYVELNPEVFKSWLRVLLTRDVELRLLFILKLRTKQALRQEVVTSCKEQTMRR